MRLLRLDLAAVGPFTDRVLSFDSLDPGLHLVFGPNEAGKSSALRALNALFFGFPERSVDNFRHDYKQLLVGGTLARGDRQLTFFRRKRRPPADLLDADGNLLTAAGLAPFLAGLDDQLFSSLCGLNHETLVRGGEDILSQHGEVGQALFAAGAGVTALQEVLASLDAESDSLFRPRGSKQALNEALARYDAARRAMREASLAGREWKEHQDCLAAARERFEELEARRRELNRRLMVLQRLRQTIPLLARRREILAELEIFGAAPVLPLDFGMRRKEAAEGILTAKARLAGLEKTLDDIRKRRESIFFRQEVLERAAVIERLQQGMGAYEKARKDRPTLVGLKSADRSAAEQALAMVRPGMRLEEAGSLRPILTRRRQLEELTARHEALRAEAARARADLRRLSQSLDKARHLLESLPQPAGTTELEAVVRLARKSGDLDELLAGKQQAAKGREEASLRDLQRLGHWGAGLRDLANARLPLPERIAQFEQQFQEVEEEGRRLARVRRELTERRREIETELRQFHHAGAVVSETDLAAAREERDRQWDAIRQAWLSGGPVEAGPGPAERADYYEGRVAEADAIADRIRREAERVQRFAALRAGMEGVDASLAGLAAEGDELEQRRMTLLAEWRGIWAAPVNNPASPREMLAWLHRFEALREKVAEVGQLHAEAAALDERRRGLMDRLREQLAAMGEKTPDGDSLAAPLALAETMLERELNARRERARLTEKIHELTQSQETVRESAARAEDDLARWETDWAAAVAGLGEAGSVTPENAGALLDALREALAGLQKVESHEKRMAGIDRDCREFEAAVAALCREIAPELADFSPAEVAPQLQSLLVETRKASALAESLTVEAQKTEARIIAARETLAGFTASQEELVRLAGCADAQGLAEAEERSVAFHALKRKLAGLEADLLDAGGGMTMADLAAEALEVDSDSLPGEIESLSHEIAMEIEPEMFQLRERIGEERQELARMDGSGRAADAAGEMEAALARIRRLAGEYVRLKLAGHVLREAMERFRAENQDPVLSLASAHFARLTLGAFAALKTDVDDNGRPILVAMRPDGAQAGVEAMSSGTRDQLFLALRLAALDWRHQRGEPLPLILDDILINFDDARSRATLEVLADLGRRFQVILFTHHERIMDDATGIAGPVAVHRLE